MKRIHYLSGLLLTFFVGLHLLNHFVSIFGIEAHIDLMNKLRLVYRNKFIETVLLTSVLIQIISGIKLFSLNRKYKTKFYYKLHIWSGMYLAIFLIIHVGAILTGRYYLNLDTNFYFGVVGLNTFPLNLFFIPYYGFAIISFFSHIATIHFKKMKVKILGFTVRQQANLILGTGIIATIIILYGLTNGFIGVEIPQEYQLIK